MRKLFRFERRHEKIAPTHRFVLRLSRNATVAIFVVALALGVGVMGYRLLEGMSWIDAFANAAMILSGMGPLSPLQTDGGKIFAALYALASGLIVVFSTGVLLAPVAHRFFHRFHLDGEAGGHGPGDVRGVGDLAKRG